MKFLSRMIIFMISNSNLKRSTLSRRLNGVHEILPQYTETACIGDVADVDDQTRHHLTRCRRCTPATRNTSVQRSKRGVVARQRHVRTLAATPRLHGHAFSHVPLHQHQRARRALLLFHAQLVPELWMRKRRVDAHITKHLKLHRVTRPCSWRTHKSFKTCCHLILSSDSILIQCRRVQSCHQHIMHKSWIHKSNSIIGRIITHLIHFISVKCSCKFFQC
mmetsp:Transcript_14404/g.24632  ORF Transcript_14404/g.24632 Transcript_14404/m.24632 type:complete len:220 (-) Transcript_14404:383-1042(-)